MIEEETDAYQWYKQNVEKPEKQKISEHEHDIYVLYMWYLVGILGLAIYGAVSAFCVK